MSRTLSLISLITLVVVTGFAGEVVAGHYQMLYWRQWERSECGGVAAAQVCPPLYV